MIERRSSPRALKTEPVRITVQVGHAVMGILQNLGEGGALVSLAEELELGVFYRIELGDSEGVLSLLGEALRIHLPPSDAAADGPRHFTVAFEFAGMDDATAKRLKRLVSDIGS